MAHLTDTVNHCNLAPGYGLQSVETMVSNPYVHRSNRGPPIRHDQPHTDMENLIVHHRRPVYQINQMFRTKPRQDEHQTGQLC